MLEPQSRIYLTEMTRIDENQEAMARITFAVDNYDMSQRLIAQEHADNDADEPPLSVGQGDHCKLGSPLHRVTVRDTELAESERPPFRHFEKKLREFLNEFLPQSGGINFYLNDWVDSDAFLRFSLDEQLSQTDL
ncbi:hypothetical protein Clacol_008580 [Clathrus columnatus]|uniref:Uncharacterized protein n=1 Tax=Clathrus columnatus TaxID=1419009 RepID=A0AAV5APL0_9AGAM|nr:hypothetical protein Clacol_008580 [Clathrus columnatus]